MRVVSLPAACATLLVLLAAGTANAQTYPVAGPLPLPYQELDPAAATQAPASLNTHDWCCSGDMWSVPFPSDFTFRYFGETYPHLGISGNGAVVPYSVADPGTSAIYYVDTSNDDAFPDTLGPEGIIAVWWEDFAHDPAFAPHPGGLSYVVEGTAPNRVMKVQWKNITPYGCTNGSSTLQLHCNQVRTYSFQLWIFEASASGSDDSALIFNYGTPIGPDGQPWTGAASAYDGTVATSAPSASIGIENVAETDGVMVMSCTPDCHFDYDWPEHEMFMLGTLQGRELVGQVLLPAYESTSSELSITAEGTAFNLGDQAASNIGWDLYLSDGRQLDTSAASLIGSVPPSLSADPMGSATESTSMTIPRPADGAWYVCMDLDSTDSVDEVVEVNNGSCSIDPLLVGTELVGTVEAPDLGAPGESVPVSISLTNNGSDPTDTFEWRIYFSTDDTFEASDELLDSGRLSLDGSETWSAVRQVFVPRLIPGNLYHVILVVDSGDVISELDETNNVAITPNQVELVKPDLSVQSVAVDFGFGCFFGEEFSIEYEVCNSGVGNAWNYVDGIVLSDNYVVTANDLELDAVPQSCPGGTDAECQAAGDNDAFCYLGTCHAACSSDSECAPGLVCAQDRDLPLIWSCQNHLPGTETDTAACSTAARTITMPTTDLGGNALEEGEYWLGVLTDITSTVNEENEGNQIGRYEQPLLCRYPAPDLASLSVIPPDSLAAGEVSPIFRVLENAGNVEANFRYRYYLSTNEVVTTDDIPLRFMGSEGPAELTIGEFLQSHRTDQVLVPDNVAPGDYYVGVVVDPLNEVEELDENNNVFVSERPVRVAQSSLRITTGTLPDATIGQLYHQQLVAAGGSDGYAWSLQDGNLPPGLSLGEDGTISGIPMDESTAVVRVRVTSGGVQSERTLALRVVRPMGALGVTTRSLPPAVVGQPYNVALAAHGGEPPYQWEVMNLPNDLSVQNGAIRGSALAITDEPLSLTLVVTDARGNFASSDVSLAVVDAADLFITSQRFAEATAGDDYIDCISASGGDGNYDWSVDAATLPPGLVSEMQGTQVCLDGTPLACGSYGIAVTVTDGTGQSDTRELPLAVVCDRIGLTTRSLDAVRRGDTVEVQLESSAGEGAVFRLFAGTLPEGLSISESGLLSGTVGADVQPATYDFVVEITDEEGGKGMSALSIEVLADEWTPPEPPDTGDGGGCSAAGTTPAAALPWLAVLLGLGFRRRR